jgi:dTDP-4-amino-4,6-dideoxygalactose transaminase
MTGDQIHLSRPLVGEEELQAVREVFESKYLTEGPKTREFEQRFAEYVGSKHGIATTSCTTGIEVCLRAVGIEPGNEVIVPDFTYPATALAVLGIGATPVLVDVSAKDFVMNVSNLASKITERTKCILAVSNLGFPLDYSALMEFAKAREIAVIEDAACSTGTAVDGRNVGSFVDAAVFSFHARKIITTGEGGMICTSNDELADKCRQTKNFGVTKSEGGRQTFGKWGTNLKMSNIAAGIGLVQLMRLEWIIQERTRRAEVYRELLCDSPKIRLLEPPDSVRYNYYCYPLLVHENVRDRLIVSLRERKIEAQICSYALHRQPYFLSLCGEDKSSDQLFPNATRAFECGLQLPLHHELTLEQQQYVCNTLLDLLE